jgi:phosphoglycolate phosphatase
MKKLIIFDMDGVIFDTAGIAIREMTRKYPDLTQEIVDEILCGNFHEEAEKLNLTRIEETEEEKLQGRLLYSAEKRRAPVFEGMVHLLESLYAQGRILALNTSATGQNCIPLLEEAGVEKYFDFFGTKEISRSKVEKFFLIQEKYNIPFEETVFITDTLGDLREAEIAGVPTVAVTWGAHSKNFFLREPYKSLIGIIDSVESLRDFLHYK